MKNWLRNALSSNAHWNVNKMIAHAVGTNAALLLADLISKRSYFSDKEQLEADGSFFNTTENIETDTGLSQWARLAAQKTLISAGLVLIEKKGLPARNYFTIQDDAIFKLIDQGIAGPLPDQNEPSGLETQSLGNQTTSGLETKRLVDGKPNDFPIYNKNKDNENKVITPIPKDSTEDRILSVIVQRITAFVTGRSIPTSEMTALPSDVENRLISLRDTTLVEDKERIISLLERMIEDRISNPKIAFLKDIALNLTREVWLGAAPTPPPKPLSQPEPAIQVPEHPLMQEFIRWAMTDEGLVRKHICTVEFYEEYKRLKERGEV